MLKHPVCSINHHPPTLHKFNASAWYSVKKPLNHHYHWTILEVCFHIIKHFSYNSNLNIEKNNSSNNKYFTIWPLLEGHEEGGVDNWQHMCVWGGEGVVSGQRDNNVTLPPLHQLINSITCCYLSTAIIHLSWAWSVTENVWMSWSSIKWGWVDDDMMKHCIVVYHQLSPSSCCLPSLFVKKPTQGRNTSQWSTDTPIISVCHIYSVLVKISWL